MGAPAGGGEGHRRASAVPAPRGRDGLVADRRWFDSHCHLFDCEGPIDDVIGRARAAGVEEMVVAGTEPRSSERAIALARHDGIHAAVGIHPNEAASWAATSSAVVDELARREGVVAMGETGLDFFRDAAPPERQRTAFRAHIAIAKERDKALVIHTRDSVDAALEVLAECGPPPRMVFHCWSGDEAQLRRALELGAYVSFAGNVTFTRNEELRALAAGVPEDRLLVETDSPYLTPVPHRGKPNEPAHVALVGAAVAAARGATVASVAATTRVNATRLFGVAQT